MVTFLAAFTLYYFTSRIFDLFVRLWFFRVILRQAPSLFRFFFSSVFLGGKRTVAWCRRKAEFTRRFSRSSPD